MARRGGLPSAGSDWRASRQRRRWFQATRRPQRGGRRRWTARRRGGRRLRGGGEWRRTNSSPGKISEEGPDLLIHLSEIILQAWHTNMRHHGNRTANVASPRVQCKHAESCKSKTTSCANLDVTHTNIVTQENERCVRSVTMHTPQPPHQGKGSAPLLHRKH